MAFITIVIMGLLFWLADIIFRVVFIILSVTTIILQFVFSRRKNPWWVGLILPGLVFGVNAYLIIFCVIGGVLGYWPIDFWATMCVLGVMNIPTAVYLLIYFLCRIRKKKSKLDAPTNTGNGVKIGQG